MANSLTVGNGSNILARVNGTGNAGNIGINTTGDITISGTPIQSTQPGSLSSISTSSSGQGDAGKITIATKGNLSINNQGGVFATIESSAVGNSQGIKIKARNITLDNYSSIESSNYSGFISAIQNLLNIIDSGDSSLPDYI